MHAEESAKSIRLAAGLPAIPERLLLSHARGGVLFVAGAGVSMPSGLPDFRTLVIKIYDLLDSKAASVLSSIPNDACEKFTVDYKDLDARQIAEVNRFLSRDYDVVVGMLERRMSETVSGSSVRAAVRAILIDPKVKAADIHRALMSLSDRGGSTSIVTTNFDDLLRKAAARRRGGTVPARYSLGAMPWPSRQKEFAGVMHIHGMLGRDVRGGSDLVITDRDFGEAYMRRRVVPDFIYDAARIFNLVLVGYSANDPPMRYLLNAVAADHTRFGDIRERFAFVACDEKDNAVLNDWRSRGITPIPYSAADNHWALTDALKRWAAVLSIGFKSAAMERELVRIAERPREKATASEKDLFDHIFRRSNASARREMIQLLSEREVGFEWLEAILRVVRESGG